MNAKTILFTALLLTMFVGTSILALFTAKKVTTVHTGSKNNPDFFMINATYTKFNPQGDVRNKIQTSKLIHFDTDNVYLFDNPKIVMNTPGEEPWNITSNKGKSKKGKDKIHLWDDVKIIRAAGVNNSDFDIKTTALTIFPDAKFAETDKAITIIQSGNITKAVGAEADFKTGNIKLLSKIEGTYQVN